MKSPSVPLLNLSYVILLKRFTKEQKYILFFVPVFTKYLALTGYTSLQFTTLEEDLVECCLLDPISCCILPHG